MLARPLTHFNLSTRKTANKRKSAFKNERHEMEKQTHYWDVLKKDAEACFRIGRNVAEKAKAAAENPGFEAQYADELAKHGLQKDFWRGIASTAAA